MKRIEAERAKLRKAQAPGQPRGAKKTSDPVKSSEQTKGDARDIAASKVGLSPQTAERAEKVVDEIDRREEAGDKKGILFGGPFFVDPSAFLFSLTDKIKTGTKPGPNQIFQKERV